MRTDEVIEPSEIFTGRKNEKRPSPAKVNPWIRFLARYFDYSLFFLLILFFRRLFFKGGGLFQEIEGLVPFEYLAWVPIEALFLSTIGTTPGKFFLKTKLKAGKRARIRPSLALRRSFSVWVRGIGLGFPFLNAICMFVAYYKLKTFQITTWDREDHIEVVHYPIGRWRIYVAVFIALGGVLYYTQEKTSGRYHGSRVVRSVDECSSQEISRA